MLRGAALRDELVRLAEKRGLSVRLESLARGVTGGLCRVHGVATVFVDQRSSVDAQIEVLAGVLRRFDWSDVFVHPSLRKMLGAGALDDGDVPEGEHAVEALAGTHGAEASASEAAPTSRARKKPPSPDAKPRPRRAPFAPRPR